VLSCVKLPCRNATLSMPVSLCDVGGPSIVRAPLGNARAPLVQMALVSSLVVTSSSTTPYVNLLCRVKAYHKNQHEPLRYVMQQETVAMFFSYDCIWSHNWRT
jgi:hypothetical protein